MNKYIRIMNCTYIRITTIIDISKLSTEKEIYMNPDLNKFNCGGNFFGFKNHISSKQHAKKLKKQAFKKFKSEFRKEINNRNKLIY